MELNIRNVKNAKELETTNNDNTMSEEIPTPRTDAREWDWNEDCTLADDMIVPAEFARQLERDLAEAKTALELSNEQTKRAWE